MCIIYSSVSFGQIENYAIKNINANKKFQDFGVAYYGDSIAVFSSSSRGVFMKRVWSGNHQPFLSLYQGNLKKDGNIVNIKPFGKKLDTKYHESNLAFTKDLKNVYFSRNNYYHKKYKTDSAGVNLIQIYKAQIDEKGKWNNIERLPFNSDQYDSGHPTLNKDETQLYFASNMPGSYGETDIYVVDIHSDGTYGIPKNLGPVVNTSQKELFPFIDENNILYYSSNGHHKSNGKLDIYATKKGGNKTYFNPINLGYPINSNADDFAFVKRPDKRFGHFSSNRKGGKGDDDIYSFEELNSLVFECPEKLTGTVTSDKNQKALPYSVVTLYYKNEQLKSMITDEDGVYSFEVQCNSDYTVVATKKHFEQVEKKVSTILDGNQIVNISLTPKNKNHFVELRDKIMLNIKPIYFDKSKATISLASESELQMVVELMNTYPNIIIQIRAYTDSQGKDEFNMKLSNKRAMASMEWILKKGIAKNRVFASGFGETELVNKCSNGIKCTKEEHLANRRVEFVVLNPHMVGR